MQTVQLLRRVCAEISTHINAAADRSAALQAAGSKLEALYFDQKPTQVWYFLEVAYSLLMPAHTSMMEELFEFQVSIMADLIVYFFLVTFFNFIATLFDFHSL